MSQLTRKYGIVYRRNVRRKGRVWIDTLRLLRCGPGQVVVALARSQGLSAHYGRLVLQN